MTCSLIKAAITAKWATVDKKERKTNELARSNFEADVRVKESNFEEIQFARARLEREQKTELTLLVSRERKMH